MSSATNNTIMAPQQLFPFSGPVRFFHLLVEVIVAVLTAWIVTRPEHQFWVGSKVAVLVQQNVQCLFIDSCLGELNLSYVYDVLNQRHTFIKLRFQSTKKLSPIYHQHY